MLSLILHTSNYSIRADPAEMIFKNLQLGHDVRVAIVIVITHTERHWPWGMNSDELG